MFQKLLVPLDGSEHSKAALHTAMAMARESGGSVVALHVIEIVPYMLLNDDPIGVERTHLLNEMVDDLKKKAEKIFDEVLTGARDVPVKKRTELGHAASVICQVAKNEGCDLIVMGTRGLSDLKGLLLGSVSHRVLQRSEVPVLLVKGTYLPKPPRKVAEEEMPQRGGPS